MRLRHILSGTLATAVATASATVPATAITDTAPATGVLVQARFAPAGAAGSSQAVTHDTKRVPVGSRVTVLQRRTAPGGNRVVLRVAGLDGHRTFGAHVHAKPCGKLPDDSGPHYQNRPDPRQPSTDPAYANAANEVWLDLTTDRHGGGRAEAVTDWRFRPGQARSVVIHEHATATGPGHAGQAGARLACVNVPFT